MNGNKEPGECFSDVFQSSLPLFINNLLFILPEALSLYFAFTTQDQLFTAAVALALSTAGIVFGMSAMGTNALTENRMTKVSESDDAAFQELNRGRVRAVFFWALSVGIF